MPAPSILERLPPEIRVQIWRYAQTSRTRYLFLQSRKPEVGPRWLLPGTFTPLKLCCELENLAYPSLLRVCKIINQEAKNMVFEENTFRFLDCADFVYVAKAFALPLSKQMQHLWINVPLRERCIVNYLSQALAILSNWREESGALQTITLAVGNDPREFESVAFLREFGESSTLAFGLDLFREYMEVLRESRDKHEGQWKGLSRRLEIQADIIDNTFIDKPHEALQDLNDAFGGELWLNDHLCYKDGTQIFEPFKKHRLGYWYCPEVRSEE